MDEIEIIHTDVLVAGTGSAGYCAADQLSTLSVRNILMITDKIMAGTSRNAGSDKQTYYKLTLAGGEPDSVRDMAETLFSGGAMDGDLALAEAAWSARAFYHLVEAGVPFPHNSSGEYVGYKTDHDPRQRATSVGPYTSKSMVEHLQARVLAAGVPVMEGYRIVDLIVDDSAGDTPSDDSRDRSSHIRGVLCWKIDEARFVLFQCDYLIYATGGPAGIYADSVYPHGQWGAQGAALRAGAVAKNLTEWQFGMASIKPRWNVSGTYMQVVPRFVSTNPDGSDEREFLSDAVNPAELGTLLFLKGYQWPFDIRKAHHGSSLIDLLVYRETVMNSRRVFLDFRQNFTGYDPSHLSPEASGYLAQAGVLDLPTPIQRLRAMNEPAYQFYREKNPGVDLEKDLLEIAVCAQHNNGGLACDSWWQSTIHGLFPVGEAAGAHGVYRPGGAALNSGQVGAMRAATYIAHDLARRNPEPNQTDGFIDLAQPVLDQARTLIDKAVRAHNDSPEDARGSLEDVGEHLAHAMRAMSDHAGLVRTPEGIQAARDQVQAHLQSVQTHPPAANPASRKSLDQVFLLRDILSTQYVYLWAMADYLACGGRSRGSVFYTDPDGDLPTLPGSPLDLDDSFRFTLDNGALDTVIQETHWNGQTPPTFHWRPRRPIPAEDSVFESVWKTYRAWSE